MHTSKPTPEILVADYQVGLATRNLPAAERLEAARKYRKLPLAQRLRYAAYWEGRLPRTAPMALERLLEVIQPRPRRTARSRKAVQ